MSGPHDQVPNFNPESPRADPPAPQMKWEAPGTDPLSKVALNPQPFPPKVLTPEGSSSVPAVQVPAVQFGDGSRPPGPASTGERGVRKAGEHGARNGIIAVLIIAVLLTGVTGGIIVVLRGGQQVLQSPGGTPGSGNTQQQPIPTVTIVPKPTTAPKSTATSPASQPTATTAPKLTATPRPQPTNTPVTSCQPIHSGGPTAMTPTNAYLNVDGSIGASSSGAQVHWDPASGMLTVLNGATFDDKGGIGSGGFNSLTCAQIKAAAYSANAVSPDNGKVFLVKTAGGHLAKVLVTLNPGDTAPTLTWQTYKP